MKAKTMKPRHERIALNVLAKIADLPEYDMKHCGIWWDDSKKQTHYLLSFKELAILAAACVREAPPKRRRRT